MTDSLEDLLGTFSSRPTSEPEWDADASPAEPLPLVATWLRAASDAGVLAGQTTVLATATADGLPSARTVLIADISDDGFWFATSAASPAGRDLAANPRAALVLHLREQARQIRVAGDVHVGDPARSSALFHRRGSSSQAVTLAGTQSAALPADADARIAAASARLKADPDLDDPDWTAYVVVPQEIEFWQSRHDGGEQRLLYRATTDGWERSRLWP